MRILFWGTPAFALPSLRALGEEGHEVVGVVTQPDRPAGRGRRLRPSPVKELALQEGYPVLQPEVPRGEEFLAELRDLAPELSVVVAYGHILRREVLDLPPQGSLNVHASLLPRLRGAAPIHWAVLRGHPQAGVTIMRMVEAMDAGPMLFQAATPIGPKETVSELSVRLSEMGAGALMEALALLSVGGVVETEQDHSQATLAPKINRELARIDWGRPAMEVANWIRGLDSVPGAWSPLMGKAVKLFRPQVQQGGYAGVPGEVMRADSTEGLVVATGSGAVMIGEVQPSGKARMPVEAWLAGRGVEVGRRFGP
ncbi:MAG: methionyl-tRNA formyltransferase [Gemmatimonadota bacterium]